MSTKQLRYGKPFTNGGEGKAWYSRYAGEKVRIGRVTQAEAEAWVEKENAKLFLTEKMGVSTQEVVKKTWADAVLQREKDMKGVDDWVNQHRAICFWSPFFADSEDMNDITPDFVDNIVRAAFGADAGTNPVVKKDGTQFAVIRAARGRVVHVALEDRGLKPGHKTSGNRTANVYIQTVQTIFNKASGMRQGNKKRKPDWNWGVKAYKFVEYPEPGHRTVFLTPVEVWQLVEELTAQQRDITLMAVATLWRREMILMLEWDWINFDNWSVTFPETDAEGKNLLKNGEPLSVPLNETAMAIILGRRAAANKHPKLVFTWNGSKQTQVVQRSWHKRVKASGIGKHVVLHSMRHTGASWLHGMGYQHAQVSWLGGWSIDPRIFGAMANYMHAAVDRLRPVSNALHDELMRGRAEYEAMKKQGTAIEAKVLRSLSAETIRVMGHRGGEIAQNVPVLSQSNPKLLEETA